jgi:2-dehydropantoate 2-reductase
MKFAVVGAGGVGAYFGGRLAEAGHQVTFIARGAHLVAIREHGLRVASTEGDFSLPNSHATDDIASVGTVDVVLFAVKAWQVREASERLPPLMGAESAVLTLQNGVEAPEEVARLCGRERVIAGLCRLMSYIEAPGVIRHAGVTPTIDFGALEGGSSATVETLKKAFEGCRGVTVTTPSDIQAALWDKFLFIAPFSAVGAVTRKSAGGWRHVPQTRSLLEAAMREVVALAQARGVDLPDSAIGRTLAFVDKLPAESTASMQRDLLDGKPSELEAQTGAIVRLAAAAAVEVPVNAFLYAALLPAELQARSTRPPR